MEIKKLVIVGIAVVFIILIVLLIFNFKGSISGFTIGKGVDREITVDAKMFEFNPSVIKVKEGERIRLKVNSLDVEHSIYIPELEIHVHGEEVFVADKKGEFEFYCHSYCGSGHEAMKGVLIVE